MSTLLHTIEEDGKGTILADNPLDFQSGLTCQSCGIQKPQTAIAQLESDLESRLEAIKSDKDLLLEALSTYASTLHHNHYLMVAMKRYLMYLLEHNNPQRIQLGKHLLTIYNVITPGLTKERGLTLFEVSNASAKRASFF